MSLRLGVSTLNNFEYQVEATCRQTLARAGRFQTPHGMVETPRFMPVGTLANVKTVTPDQLRQTGAQMVLANTYHLHLQPGEELVEMAGGGASVYGLARPDVDGLWRISGL